MLHQFLDLNFFNTYLDIGFGICNTQHWWSWGTKNSCCGPHFLINKTSHRHALKSTKGKAPQGQPLLSLHYRRKTQATSKEQATVTLRTPSSQHQEAQISDDFWTNRTNCVWESKWPVDLLKHTCLNLTTQYILLILTTLRLKTTILETDKFRRKTWTT